MVLVPRCSQCGNKTRFDVEVVRRTKVFEHWTLGGDFNIDASELLEEFKLYQCRWCKAKGEAIEWIEHPSGQEV